MKQQFYGKSMTRFVLFALSATMAFGLFLVPLVISPAAAYTGNTSTSPSPDHEISGSCSNTALNCGHVVCGQDNGGKLQAGIAFDVGYARLGVLGGSIEIVDNTALTGFTPPNPALLGTILSVTKTGSTFTLKGIIENTPLVTACGNTLPNLPATYKLSGSCGFDTIATFKADDGITGSFSINVACA